MVPWVLAVLAATRSDSDLSSTATAQRELVIGVDPLRYGVLNWDAIPQPEEELKTTVGTRLVFKYGTDHDVVLVNSETHWLDCDLQEMVELASTTEGGGAAGER